MEEASVAGESPDRSKQRESSAEPASGSAGSVPEARDPRLTVAREKDSSDGGGTDTATKVLSVRDAALQAPAAPDEDTALRDAASAWVRGADEESPEREADAPEKPSAAKAAGEKDAQADAAEADAAEDGKKADADTASRTKAGTAAEKKPAGAAGTGAGANTSSGVKLKAGDRTHTGTQPKPAARTGTDTPEAPAEAKAATSTPTPPKAATEAPAEAKPKPDADADAKPKAASKAPADAKPKPKAAVAASAGAKADADEGAAEAEKPGDGPEAADGEDAPQGPPAADDETRTGGAGGNTDAEGEAEAAPSDAPQAPRGNTDAEGEAEAAPADAPQAPRGNTDAEGEAEAAPADAPQAPRVDQPTTVIKAVRPKKPEVDQPTTMLKLGGKPKAPEPDAERTSKFVALKDDMRPAAETPAPAADATATVPQVGPERTTQQPLPPKPPLDLLAELTNTPPPPETPVRTLVRRVKIWTPLVLLLAVILAVVQAVRPLPSPGLALTAEDTYTFQGGRTQLPWPGEGQGWIDVDGVGTMGHFGKQTPVAIGSVAKTMTAYIILKDHPLKPGQEGPKIKVDAKAEKEGGYDKAGESTLNTVKAGDHLTEKQALSAVLIPSANNIARLLARWDAGSEAAFVKKMNATAKELGMTDTTYTDPSGLKESTVSTAEDQVKLGRAFVRVPALVAISSAASWTDPSGRFWPNYNELPYRIGAIGIKTGSTTAAGGNLLFASRKRVGGQTVTLVGAVLGQHKPEILKTVNEVSKTALLAAQEALTSAKILKKGQVVGYVDDRLGGHTPVVITKDVSAVGWSGLKVKLSFAADAVPHTAKAGAEVGTLTVGDGSAGAVKVPVALQRDLAEPGLRAKLTRLG
ncbi:D-alanyl-D-alanine carboxypeptidase [Streptomyces sp. NPDC006193]|uniref:D-alanyl-D-alanine carboxypeptidase n=1 Tax=Streptomyces sp. NPDC006193 TaxID=3155717 RepID=UPI00339EFB1B